VSLRPTLRRNGKHMATISVSWNLDGDQLAGIVALECWAEVSAFGERADEDLASLTKGRAEKEIRDHLWSYGMARLDFWSDYMNTSDEDELARASAWAAREVCRLWPELRAQA
jgi:hypothetical protein